MTAARTFHEYIKSDVVIEMLVLNGASGVIPLEFHSRLPFAIHMNTFQPNIFIMRNYG